jgi:hypothetical protein
MWTHTHQTATFLRYHLLMGVLGWLYPEKGTLELTTTKMIHILIVILLILMQ